MKDIIYTKDGNKYVGELTEMEEDGIVWLRIYNDSHPLGIDLDFDEVDKIIFKEGIIIL